jgi:hypothetical protein
MKKVGLALFFALANSSSAVADSLYTRNLSCDRWAAPREQEICKALAREMQSTWTGHAIISPGFRVTFETVKQVYCALSVSPEDTHALVNMIVAFGARTRRLDGAGSGGERGPLPPVPAGPTSPNEISSTRSPVGRSQLANRRQSQRRSESELKRSGNDLASRQPAISSAQWLPMTKALTPRATSIDNLGGIG